MATTLFLALDQGGHASRAIVFDEAGREVARGVREVAPEQPARDRLEYPAEELWRSLQAALREVLDRLGQRRRYLVAAGLATQRSNVACWDRETLIPLAPVIGWQDRRARGALAALAPEAERIHRKTGLFLSPHYGASKLAWCLENLPRVRAAYGQNRLAYGPMAAWLAARLTKAAAAADWANAQRTQVWNLEALDWDPELLSLFGLPGEPLPPSVPPRHAFGWLKADAPLLLVTGDQQAALYAYGPLDPGTLYVNAGTGAFVLRTTGGERVYAPRLLASVLHGETSPTYGLEGTVNGAGAALRWFAAREGLREQELLDRLPEWTAAASPGKVLFLNGVGGLGSPYWRPGFESRFLGEGTLAERAAAVVFSVVFLIQRNLEAMNAYLPPPAAIHLSGGLARLDALAQGLADLAGVPVLRPPELEATARGAAYLAGGGPKGFRPAEGGARFLPRENPALRRAYRDWRTAMEAAAGP